MTDQTPQSQHRDWILEALSMAGGAASRQQVLELIQKSHADDLLSGDYYERESRPGEAIWKNLASYERAEMVRDGLLRDPNVDGRRGLWQLSDAGIVAAAEILDAKPHDAFEDFKPKDSAAYQAVVKQAVQVKQRTHEDVLKRYGDWCNTWGLRAVTVGAHPRDLLVRGLHREVLAEIKVVYNGNATDAVRAAGAQLLMYSHFLYAADQQPLRLAVFSETIGAAYVDFLESLEIASAWPSATTWAGSATAVKLGLAEIYA